MRSTRQLSYYYVNWVTSLEKARRKRSLSLQDLHYLCVMAFPFSLLEIFQSHNEFILFYHFDVSIKLLFFLFYRSVQRRTKSSEAHNGDVERVRVEITNIRNYLFLFSRHFPLLNLFYLIWFSFHPAKINWIKMELKERILFNISSFDMKENLYLKHLSAALSQAI